LNTIVIIGAGGFGRECLQLLRELAASGAPCPQVLGFVDAGRKGQKIHGLPVLGDDAWALETLSRDTGFVIATGRPALRRQLAHLYEAAGFSPYTLIHPSVQLAPSVQLGRGCILCAGCRLTVDIHLGSYNLLNLNCTVGHDVHTGDFVSLYPAVNLSGGARIGARSELGTAAVVLPGVSLGENCVLGAGAVATKDLPGNATYVGVPARPL